MTELTVPEGTLSNCYLALPSTYGIDDCVSLGGAIATNLDNGRWWMGDLLVQMENRGFDISQLCDEHNEATYKRYMWVAKHVPVDLRREGLSWSHHREVAAASMEEQARLLKQAEEEQWSVGRMNDEAAAGETSVLGRPRGKKKDIRAVLDLSWQSVDEVWTKDKAEAVQEMLS
jgi:hypothetical protein